MRAYRLPRLTAGQPGYWCRIYTFGRAANGCAGYASCTRTSAASGSRWDMTTIVIPGNSRDMTVTDASSPSKRLEWQLAEVRDVVIETYRVKSLLLLATGWPGHLPGQHIDVRLTAENGYQAQRSYSIASPPEDELLSLTVERVDDGEVSPYLVDELRIGGRLELRGPIGGYFVLAAEKSGPLWVIAGGAGITPLMAKLCHPPTLARLTPAPPLHSSRSLEDIIY